MASLEKLTRKELLGLALVLLVAIWFRFPLIGAGLPYFYNEDEAHHFNRVVNMVKAGELNPRYFHKPSLHFYLRMPVVATSFLWSVKQGYLQRIEQIRTADRFGIAGYAFTASHPGIVKWNRAFSVGMDLAALLLVFFLARRLTASARVGLFAAAIFAVTPLSIMNSSVIGVDTLMMLTVLIAVYLAVLLSERFTTGRLVLAGLAAGLAISSKYNAAPIAILPLIVCLLSRKICVQTLLLSALMPVAGFLLGSPYILVSLPLFLDHFAYEIWHYGVAGHEGHSAEPGLPQAWFYIKWMAGGGVGLATIALACIGTVYGSLTRDPRWYVVLYFPLIYFLMMCTQKVNFTRNLLVMLPYLAVLAGLALDRLLGRRPKTSGGLAAIATFLIVGIQPAVRSFSEVRAIAGAKDSRTEVIEWLQEHERFLGQTAVSGELQLPPVVYSWPGVEAVRGRGATLGSLYQAGFDRVVIGGDVAQEDTTRPFAVLEKEFAGSELSRIVRDPQVRIYSFPASLGLMGDQLVSDGLAQSLTFGGSGGSWRCPANGIPKENGEDYCWVHQRVMVLNLPGLSRQLERTSGSEITVALQIMTPWPEQSIRVFAGVESREFLFNGDDLGKWITAEISIPKALVHNRDSLSVQIRRVLSPRQQGMNDDARRLGVAIRQVTIAG